MPVFYPPGLYDAEILKQDFDTADTGTQFFFLECRILGKHQAGGQSNTCPQYTRTVRYYLTAPAAPILDDALAILGVTRAQIAPNTPVGANPAWVNLAGRRVVLRCTHQSHGGDKHERWRLAPPTPAGGAVSTGTARGPAGPASIAALLSSLPATPAAQPPTGSPTTPPANASTDPPADPPVLPTNPPADPPAPPAA